MNFARSRPSSSKREVDVPTARLYAILARDARVGVVFRRGPTDWFQLLRWNTAEDLFEAGQWFHGRIYQRRSDLSPDGSMLIYFAKKITSRTLRDKEYTYAWTAISKPPYLTALALWPKGDCWHGGGLFETNDRVWLNHRQEAAIPHPDHTPVGLMVTSNSNADGEDWPVWSRRMERDGWNHVQQGVYVSDKRGWVTERCDVWERVRPQGVNQLRLVLNAINFEVPGAPYMESFFIKTPGKPDVQIEGAKWADWDQAGRLVFAREGKLFEGDIQSSGIQERELIDLNGNVPARVEAPEWAQRW